MTEFFILNKVSGDMKFRKVTRIHYKETIRNLDKDGHPIRVGTEYHDGMPVKKLTVLERRP